MAWQNASPLRWDGRLDATIEVGVERVQRMHDEVPEGGLKLQSLVIGQICAHAADDRPHVSIRAVHSPHGCAPVFVRTGLDQHAELREGTVVARGSMTAVATLADVEWRPAPVVTLGSRSVGGGMFETPNASRSTRATASRLPS
jgi:hypothetical protein